MRLFQWVSKQAGKGALTRLQLQSGVAYTTIHKIYKGRPARYETAVKLSACTGGAVSIAELCEALPAGMTPPELRPSKPAKRKPAAKAARKRKVTRRASRARAAGSVNAAA